MDHPKPMQGGCTGAHRRERRAGVPLPNSAHLAAWTGAARSARARRAPGPAVGTQEAALRLLAIPATRARTAQPAVLHLSGRSPWAGLTGLTGPT